MSRLFKSNRVVLGEPLEINDTTTPDIINEDKNDKQNNEDDNDEIYNEIVKKAEQKKKEIIEAAGKEADKLIEEASEKVENITKDAFSRGYEEGHEKGYIEGLQNGRQEGLDTVEVMKEELLDAKKKVADMKDRAFRDAEEKIVDLVLQISRKVIGEQVIENRDAILSIVKKALNRCPFSSKLMMRVAPEDYDIVVSSRDKLYREAEGISEMEILMENSLTPGSCVLETEAGYIDASMETQINRIEKSFKELLSYEQS